MPWEIILIIWLCIYFIPTIIIWKKFKEMLPLMLVLNLALGWTGIGWIALLIWAFMIISKKNAQA